MLDRSQISADRIFKETIVMANFTTEDKHSVQVGNNFYKKKMVLLMPFQDYSEKYTPYLEYITDIESKSILSLYNQRYQ